MSYAGTYGSDETCRHDSYYRSCPHCWPIGPRATEKQIAARYEREAKQREERATERERLRLRRAATRTTEEFACPRCPHREVVSDVDPDASFDDFLRHLRGHGLSVSEALTAAGGPS